MIRLLVILLFTFSLSFGQQNSNSIIGNNAYPSSSLVEFSVKTKNTYKVGDPIEVDLVWKNTSSKIETISIVNYFNHPLGVLAGIQSENGIKLSSTHIFASQLFTKENFKQNEITLMPNEYWVETMDFRSIPVLEGSVEDIFKPGKYKIQLSYFFQKSEILEIEIIE